MDRRKFLRRAGALSLPLLTGLPGVRAAGSNFLTSLLPPNSDRVLVLVQLNGGNDGLNTLIPIDQFANYQLVRPGVYQPEASLHNITTSLSFHGRMEGMKNLFTDGKLSIVQDAGYANQNRSHFRSTDIWTTASDSATMLETGWMGRHLEVDFPDYPDNYPNQDAPHPPAVSLGNMANHTCQGVVTNLSQAVQNPFSLTFLAPGGNTPIPDDNYGNELDFLRTSIEQTNAYGSVIRDAANAGFSNESLYPEDTRLSSQLRHVVQMITGGLQTQVYVVTHNGFDTHATQVDPNDPTTGNHANLLQELSESLLAFQNDLEEQGIADRVLGMTFSEFGRQIKSNASFGTDHGTAAPMFLFGNCVSGTILGENLTIDPEAEQTTGVPMQYDFRDVYGSVLKDWFEVPESDIRTLLYPGFIYLPVADGCANILPVELMNFTAIGQDKAIQLDWQTASERNSEGFEVQRSEDGQTFSKIGWLPAALAGSEGVRNYELLDEEVVIGPLYYYRLKQNDSDGNFEYSPVRTARLRGTALGAWSFSYPFPNPASEETTVQVYAPQDGVVTYSIFNSGGQRVLQNQVSLAGRRDTRLRIRLGRLPAGAYTIRFSADRNTFETRRLMIR